MISHTSSFPKSDHEENSQFFSTSLARIPTSVCSQLYSSQLKSILLILEPPFPLLLTDSILPLQAEEAFPTRMYYLVVYPSHSWLEAGQREVH